MKRRSITWICAVSILNYLIVEVGTEDMKMDSLLVPVNAMREPDCECGKINRKIDDERLARVKIAGGRLPWLAELVTSESSWKDETDDSLLCFGTLVSLQTVLFPASCIQRNFYTYTGRSKPRVKLLGILNSKDNIIDIASIRVHPGYRKKYDNDLAIIKLKQKIDFNQTGIVPVCLFPEVKKYPTLYPDTKINGDHLETNELAEIIPRARPCRNRNPPCAQHPCGPCTKASKPSYALEYVVTRTWLYRKAAGYDYIPHYGRFVTERSNDSVCQTLFPEMLQSKVECIQQKEIRDIVRQNAVFFKRLELGMPLMLTNTTLSRGRLQSSTMKFYLEGIRAPGKHGVPMLEERNSTIALLKLDDYTSWIKQMSGSENFCKR